MFIKTIKIILSTTNCNAVIQLMALVTLINLARYCHSSRAIILGTDLIDLMNSIGIDDDHINVKYAELLHLISNEESCCYRLLDMNIQRFLISLQDSFQRLLQGQGKTTYKKADKKYTKGQSIANLTAFLNSSSGLSNEAMIKSMNTLSTLTHLNANPTVVTQQLVSNASQINISMITAHLDPLEEGELGKALTAASLHNIALKRPVLSPGALTMILLLAKNCKTLRVLHCIRTLAQMSIYNKSKIILSKEFKKVIPMLTGKLPL